MEKIETFPFFTNPLKMRIERNKIFALAYSCNANMRVSWLKKQKRSENQIMGLHDFL